MNKQLRLQLIKYRYRAMSGTGVIKLALKIFKGSKIVREVK